MAGKALPEVPLDSAPSRDAALQHSPWRKQWDLSSGLARIEGFLAGAGFDQAPWAVVALIAGISAWFSLANPWQWMAFIAAGAGIGLASLAFLRGDGQYPQLRRALAVAGFVLAFGCSLVWAKSSMVGAAAIVRPTVAQIEGKVLDRIEQPAEQRVRLVLATREPDTGRAIRVRINLAQEHDQPAITEGATIRMRVRMVPPAAPMLPGSYDFARAAWFSGLSATGSALDPVKVLDPGRGGGVLSGLQTDLSDHVRSQLHGSPGAIAAALASGDRGAIAASDDEAMRDSGLSHLLSISGLHVSAVVAAAYLIVLRMLALIPWLALRLRLPLVAATAGALAGIGYTLLSGAEVPTVRSCIGAILVLIALAIGREPLSMRMVAIAAGLVLLFWPEALVGPSFQMSFAAVLAIVALHGSAPLRAFFAPREEGWASRGGRYTAGLLITGVVIELALMPIGLFHFHRSGIYGALANVIAIPLTTLATMPLIALALLFDVAGAGGPFWWLAGKSLELLLALAHATAGLPGAVSMMPAMGRGTFAQFVFGGLWLALWRGKVRLLGLIPVVSGLLLVNQTHAPDLLISGDGRHVGVTGEAEGELLVLRESRSEYARENLAEAAGMNGTVRQLDEWPGARCNRDFCALVLEREGHRWQVLMARGTDYVNERELAAACERVDIVIAARYLPRSCQPRWLKADRRMLDRTGGLTIDLATAKVQTVAESQGAHGWWQVQTRAPRSSNQQPTGGTRPAQQAHPAAPVMQNQ